MHVFVLILVMYMWSSLPSAVCLNPQTYLIGFDGYEVLWWLHLLGCKLRKGFMLVSLLEMRGRCRERHGDTILSDLGINRLLLRGNMVVRSAGYSLGEGFNFIFPFD